VKAKPFLIYFFALAGLIGLASIYYSATIEPAHKTVTSSVSPDGRFRAVRVSLAMDGEKPFCRDSVAVLLAVYPEHFAEKNKAYEVYSAPCDAPGRRDASPRIAWESATVLRIVPPVVVAGAKPPMMKRRDVTKSVRVSFAAD
jgi:hypothetical protein